MKFKCWYFSHNNFPSKSRWLQNYLLAAVIVELLMIALILANGAIIVKYMNDPAQWWFNCFGFFTEQSNLIVAVFIIWYFFNAKSKIFKNNYFLSIATAYIIVTFIGFNFILLPGFVGMIYTCNEAMQPYLEHLDSTIIWAIKNLFAHFVCPVIMVILYVLIIRMQIINKQFTSCKSIAKPVGLAMIYPALYMIYTLVIPFITAGDVGVARNYSVYLFFTNCCPWCHYVIGFDINNNPIVIDGNPAYCLVIVAFTGLFIGLLIATMKFACKESTLKNYLSNREKRLKRLDKQIDDYLSQK